MKEFIKQMEEQPVGTPSMPERDSDYWDEQKEFFKRYE